MILGALPHCSQYMPFCKINLLSLLDYSVLGLSERGILIDTWCITCVILCVIIIVIVIVIVIVCQAHTSIAGQRKA